MCTSTLPFLENAFTMSYLIAHIKIIEPTQQVRGLLPFLTSEHLTNHRSRFEIAGFRDLNRGLNTNPPNLQSARFTERQFLKLFNCLTSISGDIFKPLKPALFFKKVQTNISVGKHSTSIFISNACWVFYQFTCLFMQLSNQSIIWQQCNV